MFSLLPVSWGKLVMIFIEKVSVATSFILLCVNFKSSFENIAFFLVIAGKKLQEF